jgi:hypothetical protein
MTGPAFSLWASVDDAVRKNSFQIEEYRADNKEITARVLLKMLSRCVEIFHQLRYIGPWRTRLARFWITDLGVFTKTCIELKIRVSARKVRNLPKKESISRNTWDGQISLDSGNLHVTNRLPFLGGQNIGQMGVVSWTRNLFQNYMEGDDVQSFCKGGAETWICYGFIPYSQESKLMEF